MWWHTDLLINILWKKEQIQWLFTSPAEMSCKALEPNGRDCPCLLTKNASSMPFPHLGKVTSDSMFFPGDHDLYDPCTLPVSAETSDRWLQDQSTQRTRHCYRSGTDTSGAHFHSDWNRTNVLDNTNSIGHLSWKPNNNRTFLSCSLEQRVLNGKFSAMTENNTQTDKVIQVLYTQDWSQTKISNTHTHTHTHTHTMSW